MTRLISGAAVLNEPPTSDEYGLVVRPVGSGPGGATEVIEHPSDGVVTSIPAAGTALLLAANDQRSGYSIRNVSTTATLYVLCNTAGGTASATNHSFALPPGAFYEDPYNYVGVVNGAWSVVTPGDVALVTEYAPTT